MKKMLENMQIHLRPLEPEDLDILYTWENDSTLWEFGSSMSPFSKFAIREYIADSCQDIYQTKQLRLIIEKKDDLQTIGMIDLYDIDFINKRAGVGILIDQQFQNKGFGCQSLELIKEYAFNMLPLQQIYAHIGIDNSASINIFEKAGFEKSGTLRQWLYVQNSPKDVFVFQLINE